MTRPPGPRWSGGESPSTRIPRAFAARFADEEAELAAAIAAARERLPSVVLGEAALERIAAVCASFDVDGLRADIVIARTAVAHAAWSGRDAVTREDIRAAARLALPHRRRRNPFDAPGLDEQQLDEALGEEEPDDDTDPDPSGPGGPPRRGWHGRASGRHPARLSPPGQSQVPGPEPDQDPASRPGGQETVTASGATFRARRLEVSGKGQGAAGRRSRAYTDGGRTVGAAVAPPAGPRDLHLTATLMASAPHQARRGRTGPGLVLEPGDLRERRREGRESNLVLFLVDASGSMAARHRMAAVKGAVLSLLLDAYQRRDKVGLICFRGSGAQVLLPPTSSVDAAARRLETMPAGGRTPLAAGLAEAHATLARERLRDPRRRPLLVVVTDGRRTTGGDPAVAAARLRHDRTGCVVVDCESGPVRLGLAAALANDLGARHLTLDDLGGLSAGALADSVRAYRQVA